MAPRSCWCSTWTRRQRRSGRRFCRYTPAGASSARHCCWTQWGTCVCVCVCAGGLPGAAGASAHSAGKAPPSADATPLFCSLIGCSRFTDNRCGRTRCFLSLGNGAGASEGAALVVKPQESSGGSPPGSSGLSAAHTHLDGNVWILRCSNHPDDDKITIRATYLCVCVCV